MRTPYLCDLCGKSYWSTWALGKHVLAHHQGALGIQHAVITKPGNRVYRGLLCGCLREISEKKPGQFGKHLANDGGPVAHILKHALGVTEERA